MSSIAIGLGVLLAVIGPLLLLPIAWLFYRFATRPILSRLLQRRASESSIRLAALSLTATLIIAVLALTYLPGKQEFDRICVEHGTPRIADRVNADGFFRTQLFPYEAHPFLETFSFIEAPDPYRESVSLRYTRDGDEVRSIEVTTLNSQYAVRKSFQMKDHGITITEKRIYEISTNRELARAAMIYYHGGPLGLLLGSHGRASCPDVVSDEGSRDFQKFYNLETIVLDASSGEQ
jgi:hypothetical protein